MKILVVGGTGMIGGHAALHLCAKGHEVAIAARTPPQGGSALASLDFLPGDYVAGGFSRSDLAYFEALVFAAGNDIRHVTPGGDQDAHWQRTNTEGVPRFFAAARAAGIRRAINIGSFYPQAASHLLQSNSYVKSRKASDDGVRALSGPGFGVISINAPFVVGSVPGLTVKMFEFHTRYAEGKLGGVAEFAPPGGVNFISTQSLSEAIAGALERGESGKAYLVGDENLTFQSYFGQFFEAVGRSRMLQVIDQEHPLMPDTALIWGRGNSVHYEPDPREVALLGYRRRDVSRAIQEVVAQYHRS